MSWRAKLQTYRFEIQSNRDRGRRPGGPPAGRGGRAGPGGPGGRTRARWTRAGGPVGGQRPRRRSAAGGRRHRRAVGGPPGTGQGGGDLRHFLLAFRECKSAKFSIESVRFVSEKEEKLKEPSGQQWAGLAEIYHATLAAKTPESIRIPVRELPERARLDFADRNQGRRPGQIQSDDFQSGRREGISSSRGFRTHRDDSESVANGANRSGRLRGEERSAGIRARRARRRGCGDIGVRRSIRSHPGAAPATVASGGAQAKRKPRGVIFLVTDTLRKDHLNIYGYPRETLVHLKKFADEGVAFSHAISQGDDDEDFGSFDGDLALSPLAHRARIRQRPCRRRPRPSRRFSAMKVTRRWRIRRCRSPANRTTCTRATTNCMRAARFRIANTDSKTARHYVDRLIPWLEEHRR